MLRRHLAPWSLPPCPGVCFGFPWGLVSCFGALVLCFGFLPGWVLLSSLRALGAFATLPMLLNCLLLVALHLPCLALLGFFIFIFYFLVFIFFELHLFSWPCASFGFLVALTVQKFFLNNLVVIIAFYSVLGLKL